MKVPVEGEVLAGKYRVERVLGKGGMGVVVAATHLQLGQRVAIKFLLENATEEIVNRFLREARAAVKLRSEHAARVLDVGDLADGTPYMVMEHLKGNDLSHLLRERGTLPTADAVLYLLHTCEAMAEAHSIGIIHRDLKPANLFLTRGADGAQTIKVLDFGISKTLEDHRDGDDMRLTRTSSLLGSPIFMSPEQLRSPRDVTVQSDIWSLGAILYELLTGRPPFLAETLSDLIMVINMQQPPPMATRRSDIPPGLEAAALRCLKKSPRERFASVGELALAIAEYGPLEARASAEKAVRTLEAAGIRVSRTPEASEDHPDSAVPTVQQPRKEPLPPVGTPEASGVPANSAVPTIPQQRRKPLPPDNTPEASGAHPDSALPTIPQQRREPLPPDTTRRDPPKAVRPSVPSNQPFEKTLIAGGDAHPASPPPPLAPPQEGSSLPIDTLASAATSPRAKGSLVMAGVGVGIALAVTAAVGLQLRSASHSLEVGTTSAVPAAIPAPVTKETAPTPTPADTVAVAAALASASAPPEPTVVAPNAAPSAEASATAAVPARKPTTGPALPTRPGSLPAEPTAAPTTSGSLKMKMKL